MFEGLLQPEHLLLILVIAVFVFGPKRLPELGKGLGEFVHGFRKSLREGPGKAADPPPGGEPGKTEER
jgi:sec-independent protein translocase protein TatA